MIRLLLILFLCIIFYSVSFAQDSLPRFSVKNRSGKVIVGWNNPFKDVVLINIQRSPDSVSGFKTILSVADPTSVTNGFLDAKAPDFKQFYRLYVQRQGGVYFFTTSSKPIPDTLKTTSLSNNNAAPSASADSTNRFNSISKISSTTAKNQSSRNLPIADSIKIEVPLTEKIFTPSVFVYTNPQGHVVLALPTEKSQVYSIKFYREDGTPLFTMNKIKEPYLTIDKTNFIRSGWFNFELYENNVMKEKYKFFIPRER
jgi:hypothetical protein